MKYYVMLIAAWESLSYFKGSPMIPSLLDIVPATYRIVTSGEILDDIWFSMLNLLVGFTLAAVVAYCLAMASYQIDGARKVIMPLVDTVRPIAALTLFPLIILLLGLGMSGKVAIIFWTAWPPVFLNALHGFDTVDREVKEAAVIDGGNGWLGMRRLIIPLSLPVAMTGLRLGMSGGWISLVSSEMLGATHGLGYSILSYSQTFRFPEMYSVIIIIALLGYAVNTTMLEIQEIVGSKIYE